jgi:PAS domain S-box-containing protein
VMLGWSRQELIGQHYQKFVSPASVMLGEERTRRFLAGERPPSIFEAEFLRKDGTVVPVEVRTRAINDREGNPIGFQGIYRDITARKQAEEALQQSHAELERRVQERTAELSHANAALQQEIANRIRAEHALQHERHLLQVTLASIGEAVIATDTTATLTFINPVAEALTGWTAQEAIGRHIAEVFHIVNEQTRQTVDNPVQKVLREGKTVGLANHTVLIARDGREVPIADSGAPIQGTDGQVYGTVMVFRDITENKQAEDALVRAKEAAEAADRIKSEFLATMSHELRTPLNVILGYTDMLMEGAVGDLPPQQLDILRRIDRNSRVLFELISMVLDLNRLEAGRLPVDVKEIQVAQFLAEIKAEMQGLCDQSGLACVWQVAAGLPLLHTDPGKLKVVIKNLLSNAVKFTKEGGITVTACERGEGVEIGVTDTGIGIAPDAQAFIFEPFRQVDSSPTRPYSGSGLGLHIVKRLLEVLGGNITVESAVGRGSTFRVWVPTSIASGSSSEGTQASTTRKG